MFFKEVVAAISFFLFVYGLLILFILADDSLVKDFLFQVYFYSTFCND